MVKRTQRQGGLSGVVEQWRERRGRQSGVVEEREGAAGEWSECWAGGHKEASISEPLVVFPEGQR